MAIVRPYEGDGGPAHMGVVSMTFGLLNALLCLPDGARIERIVEDGVYPRSFRLVVSHPDLPLVGEGEQIPETTPVYRSNRPPDPMPGAEFASWEVS